MSDDMIRFTPPAIDGPRHKSNAPLFVYTAVMLVAAVALGGGYLYGSSIERPRVGSASEVTIDGGHTGVYRLAVATSRPGQQPYVAGESLLPADRADQVRSEDVAWRASCALWGQFGVYGSDQVASCALTAQRPVIGYSTSVQGPSATLANTVAFVDHHFDVLGDLRVAATGVVEIYDTAGTYTTATSAVGEVAGAREKAEAAVLAGVDMIIVPTANATEVENTEAVRNSGIQVVPVGSSVEAIWHICQASLTEVCTERILTLE